MLSSTKQKLKNEAHKALIKKTLEGENRSLTVKSAKSNVPVIKPNCTAEVNHPTAFAPN